MSGKVTIQKHGNGYLVEVDDHETGSNTTIAGGSEGEVFERTMVWLGYDVYVKRGV